MNLNAIQKENLKKEKLQIKIVCFLISMASECKCCFLRNCSNCNNAYAKHLLEDINRDISIITEGEGSRKYQKKERAKSIIEALGNRWKTANQIDINLSPRGVRKALLKALDDGLIIRRKSVLGYEYHIKENNNNE